METKTLNYVRGGESFAVTLRSEMPDGKYCGVRIDDRDWYTPLVKPNVAPEQYDRSHLRVFFDGSTYALSMNPDISLLNNFNKSTASKCRVNTQFGDLGVTDENGVEIYAGMYSITAAQENSTLVGNSKNNTFIIPGGDENLFAGSFGDDKYHLHNSSAVIVDFSCEYVTNYPNGTELASSISDERFNRFDTGSYSVGKPRLYIYGTITGVYFDNIDSNANKRYAVFDIAVTYSDENGNNQVVLMPNIRKSSTKYSADISSRVWKVNSLSARLADFYHAPDGSNVSISVDDFAHDWADFPSELQPKLRRLYDIYDQSEFYSSAVDEESVHQSVPAELRYPTRDDNPIDMLDGRTLKGIQNIFKKGLGSSYFRTGDFFDITIPTRVALLSGGVIDANSTWRVVLLGIDHNPELEGYNRGHFAIGRNTDNVDIAFYEYEFNSTTTNVGGWGGCKLRTFLNSTFYNALPEDLRAVISPCYKYSNNIGGGTNDESAYTITLDNLWVLAAGELYSFAPDAPFMQIYDYYQSGNSVTRYQHNAPSTATEYLTRSVLGNSTQIRVRRVSSWGNGNADTNFGFVPCFTIGGESD